MAHHSIYKAASIALLTFAFNEIQGWKEQLKKLLIMPRGSDTFRSSLK